MVDVDRLRETSLNEERANRVSTDQQVTGQRLALFMLWGIYRKTSEGFRDSLKTSEGRWRNSQFRGSKKSANFVREFSANYFLARLCAGDLLAA